MTNQQSSISFLSSKVLTTHFSEQSPPPAPSHPSSDNPLWDPYQRNHFKPFYIWEVWFPKIERKKGGGGGEGRVGKEREIKKQREEERGREKTGHYTTSKK